MSDGEKCRHCGWQETEHDDQRFIDNKDLLLKTDKYCSLLECKGFEPDVKPIKRPEGD